MKRLYPVLGAAVLVGGCSIFEDGGTHRVVGQILVDSTMGPFLRTIVAPDSVGPDSTLTITINSFGSSSCTQPDGVDSTSTPAGVRIVPYDRVPTGAVACTADFASRPHPVTLTVPSTGALVIRAVGRVGEVLDSIEHTVHVRP